MKRILWIFAALLLATGCDKHDELPKGEQTLLMYLPWSGNLTTFFETNIEDMKQTVRTGLPKGCRVLVFFMESPASGRLFELVPAGGRVTERTLAEYTDPPFTTAEGIASILREAARRAPARRYALTIGSHGMAWLPVTAEKARGAERFHYQATDADGLPLTRWFGGTSPAHQTEIAALGEAIAAAGLHMEYILFDDCYMASVEVAYALRHVADHLIASTCEVMSYGFPYAEIGRHLLGTVDYTGVCDAFHDFYSNYVSPYGTISVTDCSRLDALADVMRRINAAAIGTTVDPLSLQALDGYAPSLFFDLGDYVDRLCGDTALRAEFAARLEEAVPSRWRRHTPRYYSGVSQRTYEIRTYSGITCSDPSLAPRAEAKERTDWWRATHR